MEHILPPLRFLKQTSNNFCCLSQVNEPWNSTGLGRAALPEIRVPLEALLYKVMEVGGEGPKIRVQGGLSVGRSHVAKSHALAHPVISTWTGGLHRQLISRNCGGVQQAGNSSIQLLQEHLEEKGHKQHHTESDQTVKISHSGTHSTLSVFTSQCSKAAPPARMKDEKGTALNPYLSRRHVFKWYMSVCQLTGCYPYTVNVRFCIVTLEILDEKEKKNYSLVCDYTGNTHNSICRTIPND